MSIKCAFKFHSKTWQFLDLFTSTSSIFFYPRLCFLQKAFHRLEEDCGILLDFFYVAHLWKDVMKRRRRVFDWYWTQIHSFIFFYRDSFFSWALRHVRNSQKIFCVFFSATCFNSCVSTNMFFSFIFPSGERHDGEAFIKILNGEILF